MKTGRICVASDHGGFELKTAVMEHLAALGLEADDIGCCDQNSVDYPIYGKKCGELVASGEYDHGIVICGTGIGISIAANKVKGIRCALCTSTEMASLAVRHNNANILALGGRTTPLDKALEILDTWLNSEFEGGRHKRRTDLLDEM